MRLVAYCYANGQIEFGPKPPIGTLTIAASNHPLQLRTEISGLARRGYDGVTLYVPGVPEADTTDARLSALERFQQWIHKRLKA